ncbi:hypothetical protein TNCV_1037111 [Trichonephila clavipes]|nr:hypothetical protein TNCV_1037111 [Trichonephila clavipes]
MEQGGLIKKIARHLSQSYATIRPCWHVWVSHGRSECQEDSGRSKVTSEHENRMTGRLPFATPLLGLYELFV